MPAAVADEVVVELQAKVDNFNRTIEQSRQLFDRNMQGIGDSAEAAERRIRNSSGAIRQTLLTMTEGLGLALTVHELADLTDEWTRYTNALKVAGVEGDRMAITQQELLNLADRNGISLENISNLYRQVSLVGEKLNLTQGDQVKIAQGFSAAIRVQGASQRTATYATLEFAHALDEGRVMARQFNALAIEMPVILQAVARHLDGAGGSIAGLRKEILAGKVSSEDFAKAFIASAGELQAQADRTQLTIGASFTILRNNLIKYIGTAAQSSGASAAVGEGIRALADHLDVLAPALAIITTAMGVRFVQAELAAQKGFIGAIGAGAQFTKNLIIGKEAIDQNAAAHFHLTEQLYAQAEAERLAAVATVEAAQQTIAALREEAVAYEQNIVLAEAQRAAANQAAAEARAVRQANQTAGFGGVVVGAGGLSSPEQNRLAQEAERQALAAELQSKRALAAVNGELAATEQALAVAMAEEAAATTIATTAEEAYVVATAEMATVAQLASVAMGALNSVLAFFGGGVGIAIMAIVGTLILLTQEAQRAREAVGAANATLDELHQKAEEAASSTNKSAEAARNATSAYAEMAASARDAATAIAGMDAAQREALKSKIASQIVDLQDQARRVQPRVAEAQIGVARAAGIPLREVTSSSLFAQEDIARRASVQRYIALAEQHRHEGTATRREIEALNKLADAQAVAASVYTTLAKSEAAVAAINVGPRPLPPRAPGAPVTPAEDPKLVLDRAEFQLSLARAGKDKEALRAAEERVYVLQHTTKYEKDGLDAATALTRATQEGAAIRVAATKADAAAAGRRGGVAAARAANEEISVERDIAKFRRDQAAAEVQTAGARVKSAQAAIAWVAADSSLTEQQRQAALATLGSMLEQATAADAAAAIERQAVVADAQAQREQAMLKPHYTAIQKERLVSAIDAAESAKLEAQYQKELTDSVQQESRAQQVIARARLAQAQAALAAAGLGVPGVGTIAEAGDRLAREISTQNTTRSAIEAIRKAQAGYNRGVDENAFSQANPAGYTQDQSAALKAANDAASEAQVQALLAEQKTRIDQNLNVADEQIASYYLDALQNFADIANNSTDRLSAELKILDAQQAEERAHLEAVLAQEGVTEATKALARQRLSELQDLQTQRVTKQNQGPLGQYLQNEVFRTPNQLKDDFQNVAVNGLKAFNTGLIDAINNSKNLGEVFHNVAHQILADLVAIAINRYVTQPLANMLFPGQGGAGNTVASLAQSAINFAGGSSSGGGGGGGGFFSFLGNFFKGFVGHHATGGFMRPGSWGFAGENGMEPVFAGAHGATVVSNYNYRNSSAHHSAGGIGAVQIINNTGVPASAKVERSDTGDMKFTLEPLFEQGIEGAGKSGKLRKALAASPQPVRRA